MRAILERRVERFLVVLSHASSPFEELEGAGEFAHLFVRLSELEDRLRVRPALEQRQVPPSPRDRVLRQRSQVIHVRDERRDVAGYVLVALLPVPEVRPEEPDEFPSEAVAYCHDRVRLSFGRPPTELGSEHIKSSVSN